jgi:hypothetical protein
MTMYLLLVAPLVVFLALLWLVVKEPDGAVGCVLALLGIGWACFWANHGPCDARCDHGPLLPQYNVFLGICGAVVGVLIYLHGLKLDILRHIEEHKQGMAKAVDKAETSRPKEE